MKRAKKDPATNTAYRRKTIQKFMDAKEFAVFCEKYAANRSIRGAWEVSKEDWDFNRKFPKATVEMWSDHWNVRNDTTWKRLGKMYLLGRSMPTR